MKALLAFLVLTLAFVAGPASAQLVLPNDTVEVRAAKQALGIDESRYTPVQEAHSGWYFDPSISMQGFMFHVNNVGEYNRAMNVIWFTGDSNDDGYGEWFYSSAEPRRFQNTYPAWLATNIAFPTGGETGELVPYGSARVFPLDCNHLLVNLTINGELQTFNAVALTKERPEAECYTCPAVDFGPLPPQCVF